MINESQRIYLTEKQTDAINAIYGLWDFTLECLSIKLTIYVYEPEAAPLFD